MAKMVYTEGFLNDAAAIWSPRVRDDLSRALAALEEFPLIGSSNVPSSVRVRFGSDVRKVVVAPFDWLYEYDQERDVVYLHGLVPFRAAR